MPSIQLSGWHGCYIYYSLDTSTIFADLAACAWAKTERNGDHVGCNVAYDVIYYSLLLNNKLLRLAGLVSKQM